VTDPALEQYFLCATDKIELIVTAAGIRPTDRVVEAGAGAGTVAARLPAHAGLVLVELDDAWAAHLALAFPAATVIRGDARAVLPELAFDVLLGNLPAAVTEDLLPGLDGIAFRAAVLALDPGTDLDALRDRFDVRHVTELRPDDFRPRQPGRSVVVRLTHRDPA